MNIKRAKEELKDTVAAYLMKNELGEYEIPAIRQRPVLLIGAPGIGKTQIMEQIARECQIGLVSYTITHHTRQSAIGLPFISKKNFGGKEYTVTEYTMSEIVASIYEKMEETGLKEGILFLDEVNCVSETLAPAMLQFLQCKTFGNHAIPEGWIIAAAGNPPEYNKSVREFDVVTMDRVKKIEVEPDFTVWKEYAYKEQIHPAILSYLNTKPRYFYQMETTVDGRRFATPRGWEDLSKLLFVYEKLGKRPDREVVIQYIQHPKIAKDFANYLELFEKYRMDEQINGIFSGNLDEALIKKVSHASFDERLGVVGIVLSRCIEEFRQYDRMEQVITLVFETLKSMKEGLLGRQSSRPFGYLREELAKLHREWERKQKADLLTREERHTYHDALALLEEYQRSIGQEERTGEAVFGLLSESFAKDRENLEERGQRALQALEYAFDFMEAAFGDSQEMVIFLTELNSSYYSIRFLQEWECERYYRYNEHLLFEEGNRRILEKLDRL